MSGEAARRALHAGIAVVSAIALCACAVAPGPTCKAGEQAMVSDTMYFGAAMPGGVVSAAQWSAFVESVVAPRFPRGFTTSDASGRWRSADGTSVNEASRVLFIVHAHDEASESAMRQIAAAYKSQFRQEAVLRVRSDACVSF